jgi:pyridoxal phosphate enzyme (YggS family)
METMMRPAGIEAVRAEIARACRDAGREADSVTLVAVAKTYGPDAVELVIGAGQRIFGENRVQDAKEKWPPLRARHGGLELHLVGPLQSNKARDAVALFDAIHSVDRDSLAAALAKEIARQGRRPLLFAEVNIGAEPQKAGVAPQEMDAFLAACRDRHGLAISGLMCIRPRARRRPPISR